MFDILLLIYIQSKSYAYNYLSYLIAALDNAYNIIMYNIHEYYEYRLHCNDIYYLHALRITFTECTYAIFGVVVLLSYRQCMVFQNNAIYMAKDWDM